MDHDLDYYEAVTIYCHSCGQEWPTSWDELTETQDALKVSHDCPGPPPHQIVTPS
jgi:hypothetical protein